MNKKFLGTVSCGLLVPTVSSSFVFAQDVDVSNAADENNKADGLFIEGNNEVTIEKGLKIKPYFKYFALVVVLLIVDLVARHYVKCSIYKGLNELVDKLLPFYNKAVEKGLFCSENSLVEALKDNSVKFLTLYLMGNLKEKKDLKELEKGSIEYNICNVLVGYSGTADGIHRRMENHFHSLLGLFRLKYELNKLVQQFNNDEEVRSVLSN